MMPWSVLPYLDVHVPPDLISLCLAGISSARLVQSVAFIPNMPKSSHDLSSKERKDRLAANISANGIIMGPRCFHCQRAGVPCKVDLRSGRCVECARLGQSCNQQATRIEYDKIHQSREKAAAGLEAAESAEENIMRKLLEHRSRVRRLRRQLRAKEGKEVEAQDLEAKSIAETVQLEEQFFSYSNDPSSLVCFPLERA